MVEFFKCEDLWQIFNLRMESQILQGKGDIYSLEMIGEYMNAHFLTFFLLFILYQIIILYFCKFLYN